MDLEHPKQISKRSDCLRRNLIESKVYLFFVALFVCESSPIFGGQTLFAAIAMILQSKVGLD
jgi:hypothetical protein